MSPAKPRGPEPFFSAETPVGKLAGVGPAYATRLERLGIATAGDLLHYFPRRYDDLRDVRTISELARFGGRPAGETVTVKAPVLAVQSKRTRFKKTVVMAQIGGSGGLLEAVWFNQPYLAKQLKIDEEFVFSGKLKDSYGRWTLQNPAFEPASAELTDVARLVPVYPETAGLSSKWLRRRIQAVITLADETPEALPGPLLRERGLPGIAEALRQIHFPDSPELAAAARYRFDFEQILLMQLLTLSSRRAWQDTQTAPQVRYDPELTRRFVASLPWPLTDDQRRAAHEVLGDLDSPSPMMRLLQGDVGSGKTAVAAIALHQTVAAGWQAALMAPTEVLARQHAATLRQWFAPLGIPVTLLLGSLSGSKRIQALDAIESATPGVVVGTQALIQEKVAWSRLALAVVDEQHRFGVTQRNALRGSTAPHLLTMTATPIPRSLALVAYGDQDVSVLEERPAGRPPVATTVVTPAERSQAFAKVAAELAAGRQAFVVYPLIEQTDQSAGLKAATSEFERLRSGELANFRVGLLHGRLKPAEKTAVMERFMAHKLDVLVTTSVIEVGVDVPNATVMVIEEAQQFGLSQLHQFRGRVGRGSAQSYCYLLSNQRDHHGEDNQRLAAMSESDSGFYLAEVDLKLRGPGDLIGTKQSGFDVSLAGLANPQLIEHARKSAQALLAADPKLRQVPLLAQRLASAQAAVGS